MTRFVVAVRREWRSGAISTNDVLATPGVSLIDVSSRGRMIIEADPQTARIIQANFGDKLIIEQEAFYRTLDRGLGVK